MTSAARLNSVDLVRGVAMMLMALDHVRDFFYFDLSFDPTDLTRTSVGLFLTRWLTHFCAPAFVLLAGVGVALSLQRGKSRPEQAWLLATRGAWLIFLELVIIRSIGWFFNFDLSYLPAWVIWALGWSMLLLAPLLWLPPRWLVLAGLGLIVGQHIWVDVAPETFGPLEPVWVILAAPRPLLLPGEVTLAVGYPLLPWFGVMLLGYGLGFTYGWDAPQRRGLLIILAAACAVLFLVLRGLVRWGDPIPWEPQGTGVTQMLAFLNCTKQPPSVCFLLMTLGPAFLLLALTEAAKGAIAEFVITFGRVPLFFYLLHLPLIHGLACLWSLWQFEHLQDWLFANPEGFWDRQGFGVGLPGVYAVWLLVLILLYPKCSWYAQFKSRKRWVVLSYL